MEQVLSRFGYTQQNTNQSASIGSSGPKFATGKVSPFGERGSEMADKHIIS